MSIADKIARAKEDYNDVYDHGWSKGNMAGISEGFENGRNLGRQEGYDEGYAAGVAAGGGGGASYEQGVEDGKKAAYDTLWDALQENGNRRSYQYSFYSTSLTWTNEIYNPKYPIICDDSTAYTATSIFHGNSYITDTKVPITIRDTRMDNTFMNCVNLKRIPSLTVENLTRIVGAFQNCRSLETLIMHGTIDQDIDLQWSTKLSKESIWSIMVALSETSTGKTITLSKTAVDVAFGNDDFVGSDTLDWGQRVLDRPNWTVNLV